MSKISATPRFLIAGSTPCMLFSNSSRRSVTTAASCSGGGFTPVQVPPWGPKEANPASAPKRNTLRPLQIPLPEHSASIVTSSITRTVTLEAADFSQYRSMFFAKGTLLEKSLRRKSFSRRNLFAGGAWSSTASCVKGTAVSGAGHACVGTRGSTMNTSRHPSTFAASPRRRRWMHDMASSHASWSSFGFSAPLVGTQDRTAARSASASQLVSLALACYMVEVHASTCVYN